jgi:hypothetical protein
VIRDAKAGEGSELGETCHLPPWCVVLGGAGRAVRDVIAGIDEDETEFAVAAVQMR